MGDLLNWILNGGLTEKQLIGETPVLSLKK